MGRFTDDTFDSYFDLEGKKFISVEGEHIGRVVHANAGITKNGKEHIRMYAQIKTEELCSIDLWFTTPQAEAANVTILSKCGISRAEICKCDELNQLAALIKLRAPVVEFETEKDVYTPFGSNEEKEIIKYTMFSLKAPKKISVKDDEFILPEAVKQEAPKPASTTKATVVSQSAVAADMADTDDDYPF